MKKLKIWLQNARKASLAQSLLPAILAVIIAINEQDFNIFLAILAILGVEAVHLAVNLADDFFDYKVNTAESRKELSRQGFRARVAKYPYLTSNEASLSDLKRVITLFLLFATIMGAIILIVRFNWLIILIAALTLFLGISYSGFPFKFSYIGLGELVTGIIFGPLLMMGVYLASANRIDYSQVEEEDNPFSQLPYIYEALRFMGISFHETEDVETDDVIASYVIRYREQMNIMVASWDSDFFQLIDPWVRVFRYRGKASTLWTEETVLQRFGIRPGQYADFKALVGDKADNIPGARGVGVKTAAALLNRFGSLQGILDRASEIERACIRRSVQENADALLRNLSLIRLNWTGDLPFSPEDMLWEDRGLRSSEVLREIQLW